VLSSTTHYSEISNLPQFTIVHPKSTRNLLLQRDRATRMSVEIPASTKHHIWKLKSTGPIMWLYLRDPTFSRFRVWQTRRRHIPRLA